MKPINEEQRQALIKFIGAAFESMKGNEPVNPDEFDIEEMTLQVLEIALASLTAEIVGYMCKDRLLENMTQAKAYVADSGIEIKGLYTAPPVPVINLPGDVDEHWEDESYDDVSVAESIGYNRCIAEVKRLNGIDD